MTTEENFNFKIDWLDLYIADQTDDKIFWNVDNSNDLIYVNNLKIFVDEYINKHGNKFYKIKMEEKSKIFEFCWFTYFINYKTNQKREYTIYRDLKYDNVLNKWISIIPVKKLFIIALTFCWIDADYWDISKEEFFNIIIPIIKTSFENEQNIISHLICLINFNSISQMINYRDIF